MADQTPTDAGFTLVETILATLVAAIVAGVIGTAINVIMRADEPARQRITAANETLTLTDVFPGDIASTPPGGRVVGPASSGCPGGDVGANVLQLTWTEPATGTTPEVTYRVGYRVDASAGTLLRVSCQGPAGALHDTRVRTLASDVLTAALEPAGDAASAADLALVVETTATSPQVTRVRGVRVNPAAAPLPSADEPSAGPESGLVVRTEATELHYDTAGQDVHFVVTLTNTGSTRIDQIGVSDLDFAVENWTVNCPGRLEPGATATCQFVNHVSTVDIQRGAIQSATSVSGQGPSGTVTAFAPVITVPAVQAANLRVDLQSESNGYTLAGIPVPLKATVTNLGNLTLNGVTVSDPRATAQPSCEHATLAPLEATGCSYQIRPTAGEAVPGGSIGLLASARATTTGGLVVTASSNSVTVPYRGSIPAATPVPGIAVSMATAPAAAFSAPTRITYQMTVSNTGDEPLTGVQVTSQTLGGVGPAGCDATTLAVGASTTCTSEYQTTAADTTGAVTNVVTVTGTGLSRVATATSASVTVSSLVPCTVDDISAGLDGAGALAVTVETFGHCDALRVRIRPSGVPSGVVAPLLGSGTTRTASVSNASPWPPGPATIDVLPSTSSMPLASVPTEVS